MRRAQWIGFRRRHEQRDLFYICGGAARRLGGGRQLRRPALEKFPGRAAPWSPSGFVALIGAATTFAVLNGQDEEEARGRGARAGERRGRRRPRKSRSAEAGGEEGGGRSRPAAGGRRSRRPPASGPGGTLQLAASPTEIAFDTTELSSKPGKVTIDFDNPAALEHDVAIEQDGKEIAGSETIAEGKTSVSADLAPGTYTFLCTVPGMPKPAWKAPYRQVARSRGANLAAA